MRVALGACGLVAVGIGVMSNRRTRSVENHLAMQLNDVAKQTDSLLGLVLDERSAISSLQRDVAKLKTDVESLGKDHQERAVELTRTVHALFHRETGRTVSDV